MSISLYHATVPSFLQIIGSVQGLLDKAEAFCTEKGMDPSDLIQARLAPDMHPFAYQVKSVAVHSAGAIGGVRKGAFSPDFTDPPSDFAGLRARLTAASEELQTVGYGELDAYIGETVTFTVRDLRLEFVAEEFLLSFSQPNFYFHATTAYDILRANGVEIGKRDYMGRPRIKSA